MLAATLLVSPLAAQELVMFEREGCPYCRAWNREVAPIYAKTDDGRRAPLRRVDIAGKRPEDLSFIGPVIFTPTFVLVHRGREIGRIVGYGSDEAFWGLLAELMNKLAQAMSEDETPP